MFTVTVSTSCERCTGVSFAGVETPVGLGNATDSCTSTEHPSAMIEALNKKFLSSTETQGPRSTCVELQLLTAIRNGLLECAWRPMHAGILYHRAFILSG